MTNKVVFDGECPVCNTLKDFAEDQARGNTLEFIPFQSNAIEAAAPDLSREEASRALYVITANGMRLRGAQAVFEVMSQLPGILGMLGKIMRLPPLYWIAEPFYRLFARHRHGVSKYL